MFSKWSIEGEFLLRPRGEFEMSDLPEKDGFLWHRCESQRKSYRTSDVFLHISSNAVKFEGGG